MRILISSLLLLMPMACAAMSTNWPALVTNAVWSSKSIEGESLFFVQQAGGRPTASLLFVPAAVPTLQSSTLEIRYEPGRDFTWKKGTREIELPEGSRIPFKTAEQMYPPVGAPQSIGKARGRDRAIFFGEGRLFHDLQAVASYSHRGKWEGSVPASTPGLARTRALLAARKPLRMALLGDSISAGANASAMSGAAPLQPPYLYLVGPALEATFGSKVSITNFSRGGMVSQWGITQMEAVNASKPDLLVIAFGMNDSGGVPAAAFRNNLQQMITLARQANPRVDVLLVAGMVGNPDWELLRPELFTEHHAVQKALVGDGVGLADVTTIWRDLLKRKSFADLVGNGVNHPNDFTHRIYAQVLYRAILP